MISITIPLLQQIVLTSVPIVFILTLFPVFKDKKAGFPKITSIVTAYTLFLLAATYSTMNYIYPAVTSGILGMIWLWISKNRVVRKI